jgi:hypothetical protein
MVSQDCNRTSQTVSPARLGADELEEVLGLERCTELKQECTEEILLLSLFTEFKWETRPRKKRIDIADLSSNDVKQLTRFTIGEIKRIRRLLGIPDRFSTPARVPFHGDEGLFLLLCRLAHPIQIKSLELFFGYSESTISEATHWVLYHIYKYWDFLLDDFASPLAKKHLSTDRLKLFAQKIHQNGAPLDCCWGFIDCTIRRIARPTKHQQDLYNGYKHMHALKYSAVKCPDGLIYHLHGPFEGRRNDNALLQDSKLLTRCKARASEFYLYGDAAYPMSDALISPYDGANPPQDEKDFNQAMGSCREAVEWGFADVLRLWSALDFTPGQRLFQVSPGMQYRVATVLTNIWICLHGSNTSLYFDCCPPRLEDYLQKPNIPEEQYIKEIDYGDEEENRPRKRRRQMRQQQGVRR